MTTLARYMQANIEDHVDPLTGEVNDTSLAEDAYWHFHPEDQSDKEIPEIYYDQAYSLAIAYEIKTGVKEGRFPSVLGSLVDSASPSNLV